MENTTLSETAVRIWKRLLRTVVEHACQPNAATVIAGKFEPDIRSLHRQLADCSCKRGSCRECVSSRRILIWAWEKMDEGF